MQRPKPSSLLTALTLSSSTRCVLLMGLSSQVEQYIHFSTFRTSRGIPGLFRVPSTVSTPLASSSCCHTCTSTTRCSRWLIYPGSFPRIKRWILLQMNCWNTFSAPSCPLSWWHCFLSFTSHSDTCTLWTSPMNLDSLLMVPVSVLMMYWPWKQNLNDTRCFSYFI